MNKNFNLQDIQALIIDMDGVLWRGNTLLPGFIEFFAFLHERAIPYLLATNNARKTPEEYMARFAEFGVPTIKREHILTSALATAAYLQNKFEPGAKVYIVGETGIRTAVQELGFVILDDSSQPADAVVCGLDFAVTYDKIKHAVLHIQRGAIFLGTNSDLTFPAEEGYYPGAGSILASIEAATGIKPPTFGKPSPLMYEIALQKLGSDPQHTAMLGDRLETDILGGQQAGLQTIMVLTGVDNEASISEKGIEPDIIFRGIDALVEAWA